MTKLTRVVSQVQPGWADTRVTSTLTDVGGSGTVSSARGACAKEGAARRSGVQKVYLAERGSYIGGRTPTDTCGPLPVRYVACSKSQDHARTFASSGRGVRLAGRSLAAPPG